MNTKQLILVHLGALLAVCPASVQAAEGKPLIVGDTIQGWTAVNAPSESWTSKSGVLSCSGKYDGWLSTNREYSNFELELEFRVQKGGNSGVFLRAPREGRPAYDGMEIQLLDDGDSQYSNLKPAQYCGSLYGVVPANPRVSKQAGEWQQLTIRIDDSQLRVALNGTEVVKANLEKESDRFSDHPGLKRKQGFVGLQNHGTPVDFRNLRIRELP